MRTILYLCLLTTLFLSCSDGGDVNPPLNNSDDPANLEIDVLVYDDGSGIVVINASADNVTEFEYILGDDDNTSFRGPSTTYEHTYKSSGSYNIEVKAYGPSGRFIKKEERIFVPSGDPNVVGEGYSTPLSYDGMELIWNDEFNGTSLDDERWVYDIGNGCPDLCGWGNNELEYYRKENSWVDNGIFTLEARDQAFQDNAYTSTKVKTQGKFAFQYGRVDIRAKMPKGQGLWPALWMLGTSITSIGWPKCGEIDIMEMVGGNGRENRVNGNAFWDDNGKQDRPKGYTAPEGTLADKYHVYSIIWDDLAIKYFLDDVQYHSIDITPSVMSEFHEPFYIIMNVAVGGNWPGSPDNTTVFPTAMEVDYVRVFQDL